MSDVGSRDADRLEALFREHSGAVRSFALLLAGPNGADDVVAETFTVAWRRIGVVPEHAKPWLFGVARRVAATYRRSGRRQDSLRARISTYDALRELDSSELFAIDANRTLVSALRKISQSDRELLLTWSFHDLTTAELADVFGWSGSRTAVRLHRAKARLKRAVTEVEHGHNGLDLQRGSSK